MEEYHNFMLNVYHGFKMIFTIIVFLALLVAHYRCEREPDMRWATLSSSDGYPESNQCVNIILSACINIEKYRPMYAVYYIIMLFLGCVCSVRVRVMLCRGGKQLHDADDLAAMSLPLVGTLPSL